MKEFNDDMFIVINKKRFAEIGEEGKNAYINFSDSLSIFVEEYEQITGKTLNQKYLVCNQDEPYADQVKAIILGTAPDLPALLERCKVALQLASEHLTEMEKCPIYHPIGKCPVLDSINETLADIAKAGVK